MTKLNLPCGVMAAPHDCVALRKTVARAPRSQREQAIRAFISKNKPAIGLLRRGVFEIRTFEEAEKLSTMLGSHCPDPETASIGIWELTSNAIEHGNLEIDREMKARLLRSGEYMDELERRLNAAPFCERVVIVDFQRRNASLRIRVSDQGNGFDYARMMEEQAGEADFNGRGLMMARSLAFSGLRFLGPGNVVDAVIRFKRDRKKGFSSTVPAASPDVQDRGTHP